jgi:hypothetical protein
MAEVLKLLKQQGYQLWSIGMPIISLFCTRGFSQLQLTASSSYQLHVVAIQPNNQHLTPSLDN